MYVTIGIILNAVRWAMKLTTPQQIHRMFGSALTVTSRVTLSLNYRLTCPYIILSPLCAQSLYLQANLNIQHHPRHHSQTYQKVIDVSMETNFEFYQLMLVVFEVPQNVLNYRILLININHQSLKSMKHTLTILSTQMKLLIRSIRSSEKTGTCMVEEYYQLFHLI